MMRDAIRHRNPVLTFMTNDEMLARAAQESLMHYFCILMAVESTKDALMIERLVEAVALLSDDGLVCQLGRSLEASELTDKQINRLKFAMSRCSDYVVGHFQWLQSR